MQQVRADDIAPQPWRNGGGRTRELLAWPSAGPWSLRVSLADIDADGPFSAFPGVQRWFVVVRGAGVVLRFADHQHRMVPGSEPVQFDGAEAPGCTLLDGPTRDLNLMVRDGTGFMCAAQPGIDGHPPDWHPPFAQRGLFVRVAGRLQHDQGDAIDVAADSLLWGLGSGPCRFMPGEAPADSHAAGWWLGHSSSPP